VDALVQVDVVQEPAQLGRQAHRVSGVRCGTAGVDCVQRTRWEGARNRQGQPAQRKGKPDPYAATWLQSCTPAKIPLSSWPRVIPPLWQGARGPWGLAGTGFQSRNGQPRTAW
jgi:hypothetical protein